MSVDGPITELDEKEKGTNSMQLVCVDLVSELLPQAVLLEEDPVARMLEAKRGLDIAQGRKDFGLRKFDSVEEHVFTDGHGQIVPIESQPSKRDVNAWAGRTLRRGPLHHHDFNDNHVSRERRPVVEPDPEEIQAYEDQEEPGLEGQNQLMQKLPRPNRLNTLEVARKRAASYRSRRHN